jgi:hypothetical protein
VSASFGRAIGGRVEIGGTGGYGARSATLAGADLLDLYGLGSLDAADLDPVARPLVEALVTADGVRTQSSRGGAYVRLHALKQGRFSAWAGAGIGYRWLGNDYGTAGGSVSVRLHGIDVPAEAGLSVHVHEHVALGIDGSYAWTHWLAMRVRAVSQSVMVPVESVESMLPEASGSLTSVLPAFWDFNATLRLVF